MSTTSPSDSRRVLLRVRGIVQGVGFRPFIHLLAHQHKLNGWVRNESTGVEIELAGNGSGIDAFVGDIRAKAPPLARVTHMEVEELPFEDLQGFEILQSRTREHRTVLITPDACTCADCLRELFDPADRRYRYPFINCTNCGPRYTIIRDIPYDRDKTTMASFDMCWRCRSEYENSMDRRFHAQPNACRECGPRVWLESPGGERLAEADSALREAVRLLMAGAIVAIKGLGGFHLAVDGLSEPAVSRLRQRKVREEKPFALMFRNIDEISKYCEMNAAEKALLLGPERPIVLLKRFANGSGLPHSVAPGNRYLGVFLPYTPLHHLLFEDEGPRVLVMTSGNQSDEPIVMENGEARSQLQGIADAFLLHDRDIYMRCDDSVVRVLNGKTLPVRRARGYVPAPIFLKDKFPSALAVGAELKNTICMIRGDEAFLSQHVGDLENLETLRSFEHLIGHLQRILQIEPKCIVHDLHPDYLSTQWALAQTHLPKFAVQHHHAHIASVLAESGIEGPVIGIALDGTGYGTDGTVWGGEILRVDGPRFERIGHLLQVPLPGGSMAIKEPWRMALSYLWTLDPDGVEGTFGDFLDRWPNRQAQVLLQMLRKGVNSPITSSCGRLFDAVSALLDIRRTINYEGQAAIELEQAIGPDEGAYAGRVLEVEGRLILDTLPLVSSVVGGIRSGATAATISAHFHNGMVALLSGAAVRASEKTGLECVALSGGVFGNIYLTGRLEKELHDRGLQVFMHQQVPANDACISLGQAYVGACLLKEQKENP